MTNEEKKKLSAILDRLQKEEFLIDKIAENTTGEEQDNLIEGAEILQRAIDFICLRICLRFDV